MKFNDTYKSEEEIFKDIEQEINDIDIPEELEPSNMMKKLEDIPFDESNKKKSNKRSVILLTSVLSAVATIIIAISITLGYYGVFDTKEDENGNRVISDEGIKIFQEENGFYKISSYDSLDKYFEKKHRYEAFVNTLENLFPIISDSKEDTMYGDGAMNGETNDSLESAPGTGSSSDSDYSDTNVRTEGVAEADIIKTDGKYIYVINDDVISIIKADGNNSDIVAAIEPLVEISKWLDGKLKKSYIREMYVCENKLIVLSEIYDEYEYATGEIDDSLTDVVYYGRRHNSVRTVIRTYNISDIDNISMIGDMAVDGYYDSSRISDGYLYVFSTKNIDEVNDYKPEINDELLPEEDVYITSYNTYEAYSIITSIEVANPSKFVDYKAIMHDSWVEYYVSESSIYLYGNDYGKYAGTEILKFAYENGKISPVVSKCIEGIIKDSFCIDEYNGYLRIVVNTYKDGESNSLYIFDDKLVKVSEIADIAKGERVYSARFMGDIGYFVTFYQVDPLFSVDLSDPTEPKIIGALKIPGFSEYLHAWGKDMLLGIGREGSDVKLSMFDISDPTNVTEHNKLILEGMYNTPAEYDYKTVLIDYEKNIIGFTVAGYVEVIKEDETDIKYHGEEVLRYVLYEYTEEGFELLTSVSLDDENIFDNMYNTRGMYIGDYLYVVAAGDKIQILDMVDYSMIKTIEFIKNPFKNSNIG